MPERKIATGSSEIKIELSKRKKKLSNTLALKKKMKNKMFDSRVSEKSSNFVPILPST